MPKKTFIPITLIARDHWNSWISKQPAATIAWAKNNHFLAKAGTHCLIPDAKGNLAEVLVGTDKALTLWTLAGLPDALPPLHYHLATKTDKETATELMLGWQLGEYRFSRYNNGSKPLPFLEPIANADKALASSIAESIALARDLINTPPNDMGPKELAESCKQVAKCFKASYKEIVGEDLLKHNYPAIYEVGKASSRAPRLVDISWGKASHPKVTLVGKGVCFDSGGLDIKPSAGMKLMKKDMGGAACALALGQMIMAANLPVRLRVLIPAVENSISGNAYRPSDVINTRKGLTVEVGNTDAEGRLILCDALYEADQESPDLLIDFATLTGAARTALGMDIPALFTPSDALAETLIAAAATQHDPLWRLPLWEGYREMLESKIADINSAPDGPYAGAITAALYLKSFVQNTTHWAHIDMGAWNPSKRPGRPYGGEAMTIRAIFSMLRKRFR